jgi:hypothetical protein
MGSHWVVAADPAMTLQWKDRVLLIQGDRVRDKRLAMYYLEAYCRPGSTNRGFQQTVIPHKTELVSASDDGRRLRLKCSVSDGVVVDHVITAGRDEIDFRMTFHNPTDRISELHWGQPCLRLGGFTGLDEEKYLAKCFVFLDGKLERMPTRQWATEGLYAPGQVWVPKGVDRNDVNPRPQSKLVPSHGLIGCFSNDESLLLAIAFEPYQELFQGVFGCLHSDFRVGGLGPGETKKVRGKLYVLSNDVPALLERYQNDFPEHFEDQK